MSIADFPYDPFSPEVMSDPLPFYEVMRDRSPVYYSEKYDAYFLSRFEDAWEFLNIGGDTFVASEGTVMDPAVLIKSNGGSPVPDPPLDPLGSHLNYSDDIYTAVRQAHGRPLRPGAVRRLEGFIREQAKGHLDELLPTGRFDLTQDYGGVVSAATVCHLLRMPVETARTVLETVNETTRTDRDDGGFSRLENANRLREMAQGPVTARRNEGADGSWPLVDGMLELEIGGRRLSDEEIAGNLLCVLVGGTETLPKVVAHGLMELWRHPDQLAEVRQGLPESAAVAFEEMTRFCGPAQWFGRTARVETEVAGQRVMPGQRVIYLAQSAARDEREFEDPNSFRWDRPIPRTLGFGHGLHFCIGVHVARLEGRILTEEFLNRVSDYEIDLEAAVRLPSSFQWGYSRMPVTIKKLA